MQEHFRTCNLCEAMCGVVISHTEGVIHSIKGDRQDPFSRGHICPKAIALKDLQDDPDRLRTPLKRVGQSWEAVSWEQAFADIGQRWQQLRRQYGGDALGFYTGNPTVHHTGAMLLLAPLIHACGARKRFSATSVDQLPAMLAAQQLFGHQLLLPVPDIDRTDFFLCLGGNPAASNGSLMSAGDIMGRIRSMQQRGGKFVVVDPRYSESAEKADAHLAILPGKDVFLLAALLQSIFSRGWEKPGRLLQMLHGWDEVRQLVAPFTPEKVATLTGIEADRIHRLAYEFSHATHAVAYGRVGACTQQFGGLNLWLIQVLNIVTGNLDRPGGSMFSHPAIDLVGLGLERGGFDRFRSRVRGLPEFSGELPAVCLAEEILVPGPGQLRALITHAANPVLSVPGGAQLDTALAQLEFMVSIDCYLNETTRHAHYILPPSGPLEQGHFDLIFNMLAVRNVVRYNPPMREKPIECRHDWEILLELAVQMGGRNRAERLRLSLMRTLVHRLGIEGILDILLRLGPYGQPVPVIRRWQQKSSDQGLFRLLTGALQDRWPDVWQGLQHTALFSGKQQDLTIKRLLTAPHGLDLGPLMPALPERLQTASGLIELAPAIYRQDMQRALERLEMSDGQNSLQLIGRRHVRSNNSWMHNSRRLTKGPGRCTLMMHPEDAAQRQIGADQRVCVRSVSGAVELPVELTTAVRPGVVSMPHGYGHHRPGMRLTIAEAQPGVSVNDVLDPGQVDPLCGVAVLNGVSVNVSPVGRSQAT